MLEIFIFVLENITHVQNETMTHELTFGRKFQQTNREKKIGF